MGKPTNEFPCPWAIYEWIDGVPYQDDLISDKSQFAYDLANFILELRGIKIMGAPRGGRRPLVELDGDTRNSITAASGTIDSQKAEEAWTNALKSSPWNGTPVWIHGDLLKSNLLVRDGRLYAVIDFGGVGAGDPAADVVPAWSVFDKTGRKVFRQALDVDEHTWQRARGYALHQALMIIPYYSKTNPEFVRMAKRTVEEILTEPD